MQKNMELRLSPFQIRRLTSSANRKSKEEYDEEMSRRLLLEEDAASSSASPARREQPVAEGGDGQNATLRGHAAQVRPLPAVWAAGLNMGGASTLWKLCSVTPLKVQCRAALTSRPSDLQPFLHVPSRCSFVFLLRLKPRQAAATHNW